MRELRQGLVRICAWTKQVYIGGKWIQTDEFLSEHIHLDLTHGISTDGAALFLKEVEEYSQQLKKQESESELQVPAS